METAGPFSAVSFKQLKASEERQGDYRILPCSVSEQLKTLEESSGVGTTAAGAALASPLFGVSTSR